MPSSAPGPRNTSHGSVYGQLLQVRDIHHLTVAAPEPPSGTGAPDVSLDPPRLATAVRGRGRLLDALVAAMEPGAPVPHVLTGPGGFGKTTVAAALAERARAEGWQVFWVRAGEVPSGLLEAAVEAGAPRAEAEELRNSPQRAARWVWRHLDRARDPWLLVFDNADRPEELDRHHRPGEQLGWLRSSPAGFVLVTSRVHDPALWAPAQLHEVAELDRAAAGAALADHAGEEALPGAEELAERLGGVPLALALAGRILATHRVLFPDARALLKRLGEDGVGGLDGLAGPLVTGADARRGLLSGVWELSLELVAEREPKAPALLRLLALLGSKATPIPLRRLAPEVLREEPLCLGEEAEFARTVNALVVHGLVSVGRDGEDTVLRLHPLVSESVLAHLDQGAVPLSETAEHLLHRRADHDPAVELGAYTTLCDLRTRLHGDGHPAAVRTAVRAHRSLMLLGRAQEAEERLRAVVEQARDHLGEQHPEVLRARHALADALRALDRIEAAEEIYLAVADERKHALGPDHPDTLSSRHQAALMAGLRGDLETAERGMRSIWNIHLERSEEEHPTALHALENLSYIHMYRGDHEVAEEGFDRVRQARARVLGPLHPDTAVAGYALARVAFARGDHRTAAERFERTAELYEGIFGGEHPEVAQVREWLGRARRCLAGEGAVEDPPEEDRAAED